MLTVTDLFCGGGGSSTGLVQVRGLEVRIAANHWDLAVDTHNRNHPNADHACADLHLEDPADYRWDGQNRKGKQATRRELVRLAGNAVTPPAARDLGAVLVEALSGECAA